MNKARLWFLAITAALGGFLFGFDTIVICGAEQDIQKLWNLSGSMHGWVVSSALWGTVLGSIFGGAVSDRLGRKRTLFSVGLLFFVSAVWSALAGDPWSMIAARFPLSEDAEITFEMNPATADREKLRALRRLGFNRVAYFLIHIETSDA